MESYIRIHSYRGLRCKPYKKVLAVYPLYLHHSFTIMHPFVTNS